MQVLASSLLSFQGVIHSLGVVACYSDYSSIHGFDYSDYSDCLSIPSLDSESDFGICSDMHCIHTALVVVNLVDSHIGLALLSSAMIDTPWYCDVHRKIHKFPTDYSE